MLIVISDVATAGPNADYELHQVMSRITVRYNFEGLGLGADIRNVEQYYPLRKSEVSVADLSKDIGFGVATFLRCR